MISLYFDLRETLKDLVSFASPVNTVLTPLDLFLKYNLQ